MQNTKLVLFIFKSNQFHVRMSNDVFNLLSMPISNSIQTKGQYTIKVDVSNEIFQSFIKYFENNQFPKIDLNNLSQYLQLNKEFQIKSFAKHIYENEEFYFQVSIIDNFIQSMNQNLETTRYEDIISIHLQDYIKDDKMLNIPISILQRIIIKNQLFENILNSDSKTKKEIIEFIIKYLQKNGKDATILLESIDISCVDNIYLYQILSIIKNYFDSGSIIFQILKVLLKNQIEYQSNQVKDREIIEDLLQNQRIMTATIKDMKNEILRNKEQQEKEISLIKEKNDLESNTKISKIISEIDDIKLEIKKIKLKLLEFDGNDAHRFKGIIYQLSKKSGGNVEEKGIINITSIGGNPVYRNDPNYYYERNVVDFDNYNNYFQSVDENYSWLQYDFKDSKIRPTNYSIRCRCDEPASYNSPKDWIIEASNTGNDKDWILLDERKNVKIFNHANAEYTFDIEKRLGIDEYYRYIRIKITGETLYPGGHYCLTIGALEFFGSIINKQ